MVTIQARKERRFNPTGHHQHTARRESIAQPFHKIQLAQRQ
ncbi:macrodomain Ter protein (fragment) [Burkholderia vietnamiensis]